MFVLPYHRRIDPIPLLVFLPGLMEMVHILLGAGPHLIYLEPAAAGRRGRGAPRARAASRRARPRWTRLCGGDSAIAVVKCELRLSPSGVYCFNSRFASRAALHLVLLHLISATPCGFTSEGQLSHSSAAIATVVNKWKSCFVYFLHLNLLQCIKYFFDTQWCFKFSLILLIKYNLNEMTKLN